MANGDIDTLSLEPENTTTRRAYDLSPEEWINQQQASGENVLAEPERPPLIGVPEGFARPVQTQGPPQPAPPGPPVQQDDGTWRWGDGTVTDSPVWEGGFPSATLPAIYRDGEQWQIASWSPERIAAFQAEMAKAGILNKYRKGLADDATVKAFKDLLGYANRMATDFNGALRQLQQIPLEDPEALREELGEPFVAPDYATAAQEIKGWFRQNLGRQPEDYELSLLADEMDKQYRGAYDYEREAAGTMAEYEQQAAGSGEPGEPPAFREVNAADRFAEELERRYRPEIEAEQREADAATNAGLLLRSITGMDRTVGA